MKSITTCIISMAILSTALSAPALSQSNPSPFVGFWQMVDVLDGKVTTYAIIPDGEGAYTIDVSPGFINTCSHVDGAGKITFGKATHADGVITTDGAKIECSDGHVTEWEGNAYSYDPVHDTLTVEILGRERPGFTVFRVN